MCLDHRLMFLFVQIFIKVNKKIPDTIDVNNLNLTKNKPYKKTNLAHSGRTI